MTHLSVLFRIASYHFSWLFVLREYQHGHEKNRKGKLVIIIACILTFIMTFINILD